ncbi:hypothetical protein SESBI_42350 [Sesbania bispinosa]|nr:hypothetical protein SESBI_42350 [Sesbania bispinosa]
MCLRLWTARSSRGWVDCKPDVQCGDATVEAQLSNVDVQQERRTANRTRPWVVVFALEYRTEKERPRRRLRKLIPFQFRDRRREGISHFST